MEYLKVDAVFLAQKMKQYELTQKEAALAFAGGDDRSVRWWLAGKTISKPAQAAIFYYFRLLEIEKSK